jgi:hypothetical protein
MIKTQLMGHIQATTSESNQQQLSGTTAPTAQSTLQSLLIMDLRLMWKLCPYTPLGKWPHNKDPWHHFGLTYNGWTLKAYINGIKKATVLAPSFAGVISNRYGISVGRRDLRTAGTTSSEYKYFLGLLDQVGMYNRALTEAEMYAFYIGVIRPENILYIRD